MKRITLFLALGTLGALLFTSSALATHVRPQAGAQFRVPIVLAYDECVPGVGNNKSHGPTLTAPSCNRAPAQNDNGQTSNWLTSGTVDANTFNSSGVAFAKITVCANGTTGTGTCSTPAGMSVPDVRIESNGTDIRCKVGSPTQSNCEGGALSDYTGQVEGNAQIRITDHHNNTTAGGTGETATVIDLPFPVNGQCAANPAGGGPMVIGGTCNVLTRANAVVPGAVNPAKRANVQISAIEIHDGGQGGVAGAPDATLFGQQGIFIP
jgi:hypothetical protein